MKSHIIDAIYRFDPCDSGRYFLKQNTRTTPYESWRSCKRGDFMYWLINEIRWRKDVQLVSANVRSSLEALYSNALGSSEFEDRHPTKAMREARKKLATMIRRHVKVGAVLRALKKRSIY